MEIKSLVTSYLTALLGERDAVHAWHERNVWDALGAFMLASTAMLVLSFIDYYGYFGHDVKLHVMVGAFGATAAIYGSPSAVHSFQPRCVLLAYIIASLVGIACNHCFRHSSHDQFSRAAGAAVAVAASISIARVLNVIHPPMGACAITAALSTIDEEVRDDGFLFLVTPSVLGVVVIVTMAYLGINLLPTRAAFPKYW